MSLNDAIKKLFFTTAKLNISLHLSFIPTSENEADVPSRPLTTRDCKLRPDIWAEVQEEFGGLRGYTCDLKALDSDVMTDRDGSPLPQFTPHPSPQSYGVNVFAQDLSNEASFFGPSLRFSTSLPGRSCFTFPESSSTASVHLWS